MSQAVLVDGKPQNEQEGHGNPWHPTTSVETFPLRIVIRSESRIMHSYIFERGLQSIARRDNAGAVFFEMCEAADQVNLNVGPAATPQTVLENYAPVRRTKPTTYVKAVVGLNSVVGCFLPMMAANCVKVVIAPATQIQFHAKRRGGINSTVPSFNCHRLLINVSLSASARGSISSFLVVNIASAILTPTLTLQHHGIQDCYQE
jgi:hypothetical protein